MTRTATARAHDGHLVLCADGVGLWTPLVAVGQIVEPGAVIGRVELLGVAALVVSGAAQAGRAIAVTGATLHRAPIDHGAALVTIDPSAAGAVAAIAEAASAGASGPLVFAATMGGRYYGRPAPGKPPFVKVGDVVRVGQTVALIEVMKTFQRVAFGGPAMPAQATVVSIAPVDDADIVAGDPILVLAAIS